MFDVIVVGSANLDLVASTPRLPDPGETVVGTVYAEHPGGKGLNQAIAAARSGASVALVGTVGADSAGDLLRDRASAAGVDTSLLATAPDTPTGRALITVDSAAENSIIVIPGANALVETVEIPDARILIAQLEIPVGVVVDVFAAARERGTTTILNPAPAAPLPAELLDVCDMIVPNEHEVELIGGVQALLDSGVGSVIVTRGAHGVAVTASDIGRRGLDSWMQPAFDVDPVDTTGAGDAFCGALAARLAAGEDLHHAVRWAAAAGALATTVAGAVPSLPHAVDTERLLAGGEP